MRAPTNTRRLLRSHPVSASVADLSAIVAFLSVTGAFFAYFGLRGLSFYEDDIVGYHYPVLLYLTQALRAGTLPLWTHDMFVGFPFFADGSAGVLYPLNWLALALPPETVVMWLLAARTALGGLFLYAFVRATGLSIGASLLAAFAYAFSGYSVGHWIHFSIGHSALTFPLALLCVELACRNRGSRSVLWLLMASLAHGLQWLGLHPQVALIGTVLLIAYGAFRCLSTDQPHSLWHRTRRLLIGGLIAGPLSIGLAAAQLVPMAELGTYSERSGGISYTFAASYALPLHNLATAVWPHLFLTPTWLDWGLTNRWETAFYVGQVPILLAILAVIGRRDRHIVFWAAVVVVTLWLALGSYAPLSLYSLIYDLPGFSLFRVPARFVQLTDLGLCVLAGYGFDVARRSIPRGDLSQPVRRLAGALLLAVTLGTLAVLSVAVLPDLVQRLLGRLYLMSPRYSLWGNEVVWPAVQQSLNVANPRWLVSSALALVGAGLLLGWQRWPTVRVWPGALVVLVVGDLLLFAGLFWQAGTIDTLRPSSSPITQYLVSHAGEERIVSLSLTPTGANRLLGYGLREVDSYGPLRPQRFAEYRLLAERGDNRLLDLWGARWIIAPLTERLPRKVDGVSFDPQRAMMVATSRHRVIPPTYTVPAPFSTQSVRLVGRLAHAAHAPQGETVAELLLTDSDGRVVALPIKAGIQLAEWAAERPDVASSLRHSLPTVALREPIPDGEGGTFGRLTFIGETRVPDKPVQTVALTLRVVDPAVDVEVYGISLVAPDGSIQQIDHFMQAQYRERMRDGVARVIENLAPVPRVSLVGAAEAMEPGSEVLYTMAREMADPSSKVYLEEPLRFDLPTGSGPLGTAQIVLEQDTRVVIAVDATRPAMLLVTDFDYPGWKATIDGQPTHIYRADYLYCAIVVPAGSHQVVLVFEPLSVKIGFAVSGLTLLVLAGAIVWLWRKPS